MGVRLFFGYDWFGGWNVFLIHLREEARCERELFLGPDSGTITIG